MIIEKYKDNKIMTIPNLNELEEKINAICERLNKLEEEINSDLILANIVKRIIKQDDNYINTLFGAYERKLYIDGCVEYESQEEKEFILNYIKNLRNNVDDK